GPVHRHPNPPERRRHAPTPTSSAPKGRRAVATGGARPHPRPSGTRGSHPLVQRLPRRGRGTQRTDSWPGAARTHAFPTLAPLHPRLMPRCPLPRCLLLRRPQSSPHIQCVPHAAAPSPHPQHSIPTRTTLTSISNSLPLRPLRDLRALCVLPRGRECAQIRVPSSTSPCP